MTEDSSAEPIVALGFISFALLTLCLGVVLVWFAHLRESPNFWTNSGGYPILLRDLVLIGYYPLLLFTAAGTFGLTIAQIGKLRLPKGLLAGQILLLLGCWALLVISVILSFGDNLENFWEDRPIHGQPL